MLIQPSGISCSSCQQEIDLFDGPVRRIGKPQQFPFCWECWRNLYKFIPDKRDVVTKDVKEELYIWLSTEGC